MPTHSTRNGSAAVLEPVSNDGEVDIDLSRPYHVEATLEGVCPILFHAWSVEAIEEKGKAAKGSAAKKTDNVESYVRRCGDGTIGIPGSYLRGAIVGAARFRQDPRSPRKSMMDLAKAAILVTTDCASLGNADWDYLDRQRVTVQRAGITRTRPAFLAGWRATFSISVVLGQYVNPQDLHELLTQAGQLVGLGDFRPTYGRFQVACFDVLNLK